MSKDDVDIDTSVPQSGSLSSACIRDPVVSAEAKRTPWICSHAPFVHHVFLPTEKRMAGLGVVMISVHLPQLCMKRHHAHNLVPLTTSGSEYTCVR